MIFCGYSQWEKFTFQCPTLVKTHVDREVMYVVFENEIRHLITETNYEHTKWETWYSLYIAQTCLTRYYTLLFIWLHILKKYRGSRYHSVRLCHKIKYVLIYDKTQKLTGVLLLANNYHLQLKTQIPYIRWSFRWRLWKQTVLFNVNFDNEQLMFSY